jgi:hypothetical protein
MHPPHLCDYSSDNVFIFIHYSSRKRQNILLYVRYITEILPFLFTKHYPLLHKNIFVEKTDVFLYSYGYAFVSVIIELFLSILQKHLRFITKFLNSVDRITKNLIRLALLNIHK